MRPGYILVLLWEFWHLNQPATVHGHIEWFLTTLYLKGLSALFFLVPETVTNNKSANSIAFGTSLLFFNQCKTYIRSTNMKILLNSRLVVNRILVHYFTITGSNKGSCPLLAGRGGSCARAGDRWLGPSLDLNFTGTETHEEIKLLLEQQLSHFLEPMVWNGLLSQCFIAIGARCVCNLFQFDSYSN